MDPTSIISETAGSAFAQPEPEPGQRKRLIMMRHGDLKNIDDLKAQVRHSLQELFLAYPDLAIDAVLYSPLKRTVRTAAELYNLHVDKSAVQRPGFAFPFQKQDWLSEDAFSILEYDGLREKVRELDESWNTVLLITHSTTAPPLAKALQAQATDMQLVFTMSDFASVLVLDLPSDNWKDAGTEPSEIAKVIRRPKL
ncbi:MAG: hypothetical protein H6858_07050 [Rhodospirillales bacterium]|nr:hypothetical protein [Rhodospirillales bacterium]